MDRKGRKAKRSDSARLFPTNTFSTTTSSDPIIQIKNPQERKGTETMSNRVTQENKRTNWSTV